MVTLGLCSQPKRGKSGHRRTGCPLTRGGSHQRIMESAAESKPPFNKLGACPELVEG